MSCAGHCPLRMPGARRPSSERDDGPRLALPPTPVGSASAPVPRTPRGAPLADQVPGMELARRGPCVKPAKPFKSTIFGHDGRHEFASRSHAIRVPFAAVLALVRAPVWASAPLAPDILGFQPGDGLLEPFGAVAVAGIVGGVAEASIGHLPLQLDEVLIVGFG